MTSKAFFLAILFLSMTSFSVYAKEACTSEQLMAVFEHSHEITQTPSKNFNVIIEGRIETPTPGYEYRLEMTSVQENEASKGVLKIFHPRPNDPALTVISHVDIGESIEIPKTSKGIILEVEKGYGWGPESFVLELPDDFFGSTFLCMTPMGKHIGE